MAVGFRRTLPALTTTKAIPSCLNVSRPKRLSYSRAGSASLPSRLHPIVAALHDSADELLAWTEEQGKAGASWVDEGVGLMGELLSALTDLLHHPQAQDALRRPWTDRLLDDLLLLADAHGCFRESLVALKQLLAETHAALRRRDATRLAAALRAQRRADRDLSRLPASPRYHSPRPSPVPSDAAEAALADAVAAAMSAAAAASAAIFTRLATASAASAARTASSPTVSSPAKAAAAQVWWVADMLLRRRRRAVVAAAGDIGQEVGYDECCDEMEEERKAAMERVHVLEECVAAAESGSEEVYRALVSARVSLLNILTPTI